MSAIGKGDWVQCVSVKGCHCGCGGATVRVDGVYVVESVCTHIPESPGLTLEGHPTPAPHHCYPANMFKPLGGNAKAVDRAAPAELEPA